MTEGGESTWMYLGSQRMDMKRDEFVEPQRGRWSARDAFDW
jgi:hypothetical protein